MRCVVASVTAANSGGRLSGVVAELTSCIGCGSSFKDRWRERRYLGRCIPSVVFSSLYFMPGLLRKVADITMATWQISRHGEQQSLMLPTTFQSSRYVCSFQFYLKKSTLLQRNSYKNLYLRTAHISLRSRNFIQPLLPPS